ncbi:MAG: type II secretion system protein GspC [Steroidobacteraceae bacterium]|nr:type II secretion system protein GspC [Steroidobacteraceae bacterium]MDW8260111.1 type II secretion system protein GspC [Gammaproteobacteria bacterium]
MTRFALGSAWREPAHWPRLASVLLGLLIAVQAAVTLTDYFGAGSVPSATGPLSSPAIATHNAPMPLDLVALMNANLFGEAKNPLNAGDAPATSAPLVLAGTIAGEDPQQGFALIGDSAPTARVYATGAALPGGARLHSVYRDRVLIERNGQLESLALPRRASAAIGVAAPPPTASVNPLGAVRQALQNNPQAFSELIRATPVAVGGKQRGLRVFPGNNPAAFARLGLRPGDLVTSINGTPLDDGSRSIEILESLQNLPEARVGVVRNGRTTEVVVNMTEVTRQAEALVGTEGMTPASDLPPLGPAP